MTFGSDPYGQLEIVGALALGAPEQHADEPTRHKEEEGQGHRPIVPLDPSPLLLNAHRPGF
jgi:hypothetical protein